MAVLRKRPSVVYWLGAKLYLNVTSRCSNNRYFCLRRFKAGVGDFNLRLRVEPSARGVIRALQKVVVGRRHWREVVFCGFGEPLERLDCVLEVTEWVKRFHGKAVRVDTNGHGYLLNAARDVARELRKVGMDRVSVSLNAQDEATYNMVCRPQIEGAFEASLQFIGKAKDADLEVEITVVRLPEVDVGSVREMAEKMGAGFRAREYIPCVW